MTPSASTHPYHVALAETEADIQPDGVADHLTRET
jgi:hypothetical protein